MDAGRQITHAFSQDKMYAPGILAVEAEGDLIHTAWVSHHLVKTRLKAEGKHEQWPPKRCRNVCYVVF